MRLTIRSTSIIPIRDRGRYLSRIIVRIDRTVRELDTLSNATGSLRAAIHEAALEYGFNVAHSLSRLSNDDGSLVQTFESPLLEYRGKPYDLRVILA